MRIRSLSNKGSVSVYLVLVLLLILSLLAGMLAAAKSVLDRATVALYLDTAAESMMGEYYGPLFKEYGLLGIDIGFGKKRPDQEAFRRRVLEYLPKATGRGALVRLTVTDMEPLYSPEDGAGNALRMMILEEQRTAVLWDAAEGVLEKLGVLGNAGKGTEALVKRLDTEQELAVLDKYKLRLMEQVDGVRCTLFDGVTVAGGFAKQLQNGEASAARVGITNIRLYGQLRTHYIDGTALTASLTETAEQYKSLLGERERLEEAVDKALTEYGECCDRLAAARKLLAEYDELTDENPKDGKKLIEEQIRSLKAEVKTGLEAYRAAGEELREITLRCTEARTRCSGCINDISSVLSSAISRISEAMTTAQEYIAVQKRLRPVVTAYELVAGSEADKDALRQMKQAVGLTSGGDMSPSEMYDALDGARTALLAMRRSGALVMPQDSSAAVDVWMSDVHDVDGDMHSYSPPAISFDYSSVSIDPVSDRISDKLLTSLGSGLGEGLLKLLLSGEKEISSLTIDEDLLPGKAGPGDFENRGTDLTALLSGMRGDTSASSVIKEYSRQDGLKEAGDIITRTLSDVYDNVLLTMFARDKFKNYRSPGDAVTTALRYGQEYIIAGHSSDAANLADIAGRIFLMRMLPATIYAFTDVDTVRSAKTLAAATMSFTGVPFLVSAAGYIILIVWAAEQALVETSAVMRGRRIPLITDKRSFCLSLPELATLSPELIRRKAESLPEEGITATYDEYLTLFLLLEGQEKYESGVAGLIQENIRYAYDEDFLINNCMSGFSLEAVYEYRTGLFTKGALLSSAPKGYIVRKETTYHY